MATPARPPPLGPQRIVVVGAGAVGMACALTLRREGHDVVVLDPRAPGEGASFGNAGIIANCTVDPIGMPGIVRRVPGMLLDPMGPLSIRWRYLPRIAPWLMHLVVASRPARVEAISCACSALLRNAVEAWTDLLRGTPGEQYVTARGWIHGFETEAAFAAMQPVIALRRRRGVRVDILGPRELHELEPAVAPIFQRAMYLPDTAFVTSPVRLVRAVANAFLAAGGTIAQLRVTGFSDTASGLLQVITEENAYPCDRVVIAAGAWSRPLASMLGTHLPLDTERGYHVMLATPEHAPRHPISSGEHKFVIVPMQDGIRITSGVEFAGLKAPANFTRIRRMVPHARRMVPGLGGEIVSEWLGFRPSMPDSLPVIGHAPQRPWALFAFGHGHVGLTAAASTARIVADLVAERSPAIDLTPFRADRFRF
jgi:D-amino-acid dehydrogenase